MTEYEAQLVVSLNPQDTATIFAGATPDVTTLVNAQGSIDTIDSAFSLLATDRAGLGAAINQMTSAVDNLGTTVENLSAAKSQVRDADIAAESAEFTKNQVLMQAGVSMLAQANYTPNFALSLLG